VKLPDFAMISVEIATMALESLMSLVQLLLDVLVSLERRLHDLVQHRIRLGQPLFQGVYLPLETISLTSRVNRDTLESNREDLTRSVCCSTKVHRRSARVAEYLMDLVEA